MSLSSDQLQFYVDNGYVGPVEVITPGEMARIADKIARDAAVESAQSRSIYGFHTSRDAHLFSKELLELATHSQLTSCLTQLLGPDVLLWRTTAFLKPAANSESKAAFSYQEIDWHQGIDFMKPAVDTTGLYPSIGRSHSENLSQMPLNITAWIAIDEATEESGTLMYIPGSHRLGAVSYREIERGLGLQGVIVRSAYEGLLDTSKAVVVPVPAGSCLLFNNLLFHKSMPNRSTKRRLGMACRFVSNTVPVYPYGDPAGYDLANWGCIQVAGEDRAGLNKILPVPSLSLA